MPTLTQDQLDEIRERLVATKRAADAVMSHSAAGVTGVEVSGSAIGRLTRMDAIALQAMSKMNRAQLSIRLQQIDAALRALDAGRYGLCNRCKQPIEPQRLDALPEAPLCLSCQEAVELG